MAGIVGIIWLEGLHFEIAKFTVLSFAAFSSGRYRLSMAMAQEPKINMQIQEHVGRPQVDEVW